jgi:putative radical SAM enzyme (TIGR03279 family)
MVKITAVAPRSRAAMKGICEGDILLAINGEAITDVLDYRFHLASNIIKLTLTREGEEYTVTIHKQQYDDIGLDFETPLMDKKHTCANRCIFCFIDQLPEGLRDTLYFKDDDSRLSFLHGNYITLTNLRDADIDRIIRMHISPVNISVHTTNPELRVQMMKNKRAGEVLSYLKRMADAGITLCGQIVLCRGINDGEELTRSMHDLAQLFPALSSVSVVPAGLTKYRDGLYPLTAFSPEECAAVIAQVNAFGDACLNHYGSRLFFCADELFLKAELPLPEEDYYEGYRQLENGVGMLRSLEADFMAALESEELPENPTPFTIATGTAAAPHLIMLLQRAQARFPGLQGQVIAVQNDFFGHTIDVAGLLTGQDIAAQLKGRVEGRVLIPLHMLRHGETVFLDDYTVERLSCELGVPVQVSGADGGELLDLMLEME